MKIIRDLIQQNIDCTDSLSCEDCWNLEATE